MHQNLQDLKRRASLSSVSFAQDLGTIKYFRRNDTPNSVAQWKPVNISDSCELKFETRMSDLKNTGTLVKSIQIVENTVRIELHVENRCYEKLILIRYTWNEWITFQESEAKFQNSLQLDVFVCHVPIPKNVTRMIFAVSSTFQNYTVWNNNNELNFKVDLQKMNQRRPDLFST